MKARRFDFYPDDWLVGTAGLSTEERGVYITICALIYSHGGPIPDDENELSRLCSCHWRTFRAIRGRLLRAGKISSKGGQVAVKRCSTELEKARKRVSKAVQNGRKGGRPRNEINGVGKPDGLQNAKPKRKLPSPSPSPSPVEEERCSLRSQRARGDPPGFAEWWEAFPHKVGKAQARKAWPGAIAKTSLGEMSAGVQRYIATKPPERHWCNPATWLNGERWLDDPGSAPHNGANEHDKPSAVDKLRIGAARAVQAVLERDLERERSAEDRRIRNSADVPLLDCE